MRSVESSFQYRGDLAETALPEILYTIDRFQVPGVIEASWRGVVKRVYIKEGNGVHASSSDPADSLGNSVKARIDCHASPSSPADSLAPFLEKGGQLSPEAYLETMRERQRTNQ